MLTNFYFKINFSVFCLTKRCKTYFISTPIYYPNDKPHVGHFYTNCIGDVLTRWNKLKGSEVLFSTGTDDHGIKIQKLAEEKNITCQQMVDKVSNNFKTLFEIANFCHSEFVRTSQERHKSTVAEVWNRLMSKNCLKKGKYSGWYSVTEECFVTNNFLKSNESIPNSLEWYEEDNWIFDITKFKPEIREWANSGTIYPKCFLSCVHDHIDEIDQISVSRPANRISWGIPVPNDSSQTIYVWFEALINYLTVSKTEIGQTWPADIQIIGKDIIKFHTVLWPAILLGIGMELPKKLLIHSHWVKNGIKMSKSLGNVVDPQSEAEILGGYEELKYFLLSENAIDTDSSYDTKRATEKINNHLVNILGNLLQRICSKKINPHQRLGVELDMSDKLFSGTVYSELIFELENLRPAVEKNMDNLNFHLAIDSIINVLRKTNVFFDSQEPWKLTEDQIKRREAVIYVVSESLRMCAILLQCFVPLLSDKILNRISVPSEQRTLGEISFNTQAWNNIRSLHDFGSSSMLLNRISTKCR